MVKKVFILSLLLLTVGYGFYMHDIKIETTSTGELAQVVAAQGSNIRASATATLAGFVPITRVIDGDTIVVLQNGREETVRLLGMDTPEIVDPRKIVQCYGREASDETKKLLEGHHVKLVADATQADRDKYGRLLRYVYSDDGIFVDEFLVEHGFAHEYTYENKAYEFQTEFRKTERDAQARNIGLWAACIH